MTAKLVSVKEMVAIEKAADKSGLTYPQMMENAGGGLAKLVLNEYGYRTDKTVLGLVGKGNNGGDTLIALEGLAKEGWKARAYIAMERPENDGLLERLRIAGGEIFNAREDGEHKTLTRVIQRSEVLLDGLLGTGIRLPLREPVPAILRAAGEAIEKAGHKIFVAAVDCPSGVDCDTGEAAPGCLPADLTACMAAVKTGLLAMPAYDLLGALRLVDIGLPINFEPLEAIPRIVVDKDFVNSVLPQRPPDAHKGTFGTALIAAGSREYTGAAWLAGKAAYRIGAGLVTIAVPGSIHAALAGQLPEATWLLLEEKDGGIDAQAANFLLENLERATAMLAGPGFGMREGTGEFLRALTDARGKLPPTVIDADGLRLLAGIKDWHKRLPAASVLTPHPGEMAALTGLDKDEIQATRMETAERFAAKWGHVVVLKGAFTVIAAPDGNIGVIAAASPALARAGTGDVLAGMIAGLLAQGTAPFEAACAGAWLHAHAGLAAAKKRGSEAAVLAGDLIAEVPGVLAGI